MYNSLNENNIIIELVPSLRMFWIQNLGLMALYLVLLILSGSDNEELSLCAILLTGLISIILLYRYWYLCKMKWTITRKQLKTEWGVLSRDIHYVELYRIVDYSERQSFMQMVLGLKDIIIYSSDRTTPSQRIYGVPAGLEIIPQLKELVEQQKKEYHVYEIANR